jgi:nitrate reductase gamma subunit
MGKASRREHREQRRLAAPLAWPAIATVSVLVATGVAGVLCWIMVRLAIPSLFSPESGIKGSSPATFAIGFGAAVLGGLPTMLLWRRRLMSQRERNQKRR